jgi:hypothetical protein
MTRPIPIRPAIAFALFAGVSLVSGCSQPFGSVTGTVTLGGAPLSAGLVSFLAEDGTVVSTNVDTNGNYRVDNVPAGLARVTVYTAFSDNPGAMGDILKNQGRDPARFKDVPKSGPPLVTVPQKYSTPETSGLTVTVGKGETKYDISLDK